MNNQVKVSLLCVLMYGTGCVGNLQDNQVIEPPAGVEMGRSTSDMRAPVYDDMGRLIDPGITDPDAGSDAPDMAESGPVLPAYTDPTYNPNEVYDGRQQELFTCDDLSKPVGGEGITLSRLQRIESVEWARNTGLFLGTRHTAARGLPAEARRNPFEVEVKGGFSTWRDQAHMDKAVISGHVDLMPYASLNWVNRVHIAAKHADLDCMYDGDAPPSQTCVTTFVGHLLERGVLFRPPSQEEVAQLVEHTVQDILPDEAAIAQTRKQSIELIYSAAQLTTAAIYKSERGEPGVVPDALGRVPLTDWEIAQKVGYALKRRAPGAPALFIEYGGANRVGSTWDLPPEERDLGHLSALRQAAEQGTIRDREVLADLIRQYATGVDPERYDLSSDWRHHKARGRRATSWVSEGIQLFFREWLEAELIMQSFKDRAYETSKHDNLDEVLGTSQEWPRRGALGAITSSYDVARLGPTHSYEPTLLQQLDDTIARVVQQDQDVIKNLLTTREYYTTTGEAVAATNKSVPHFVYNVETPVAEVESQEGRWRTMPANERAGILTHPTWLAAHSENFEDGPGIVKRGYWIRKHLLCGFIPQPDGQIVLTLVEGDDLSARERVHLSTEDPSNPNTTQCQGCHGLMNPLGYAFELYNHAGFLRVDDHGSPADGSSMLENMPLNSDLEAFNNTMVHSPMELAAILGDSTHVKQCFIRHTFRYFMGRAETRADACTLSQMEHAYDMNNGSFVEMLVALMTSDAFLHTRPWETLPLQGE